jgi:hypothetical protein
MKYNPEFEKAIMRHFNEVAVEYGFEMKYDREIKPDEIQLLNDKCIVRFIYDMGAVACDLIDPREKKLRESMPRKGVGPAGFPVYPAIGVWEFLYPNDAINYRYAEWDVDGQVRAKKKLLLERLTNVLNGDFSWTDDFKINETRISKKIEYMMTHWDSDNPVRIGFRNGNLNWEKEFDAYKDYLDKLQKR